MRQGSRAFASALAALCAVLLAVPAAPGGAVRRAGCFVGARARRARRAWTPPSSRTRWTTGRRRPASPCASTAAGASSARTARARRTAPSAYESWSMAKSVTALVFGRAMTLGLISPDDVVGSLVPEADGPHGAITMRDLLTMTSGLRVERPARLQHLHDARPRARRAHARASSIRAGTYFEYAQAAVSAAGRGGRARGGRGLPGVRPARADGPSRHRRRGLALGARPAPATSRASTA